MSKIVIGFFLVVALILFYCGKVFKDNRLYTLSGWTFGCAGAVWVIFELNGRYPFILPLIVIAGAVGVVLLTVKKEEKNKEEIPKNDDGKELIAEGNNDNDEK